MKILSTFILLVTLLLACKKDDNPGPQPANPGSGAGNNSFANGVFVLNEGNFTWGNGSLSFISKQTGSVQNNVFQTVNNRPLGDVPQSICINGNLAYIIVNNSQKIEVADKNTLSSQGTITGLTSPRYMAFVTPGKAYVTDLYSNSVWIVDPIQKAITGSIAVTGWTEELLVYNDKAYITNMTRSNLLIIDGNTDQLVDSISLSAQPGSIVKDINNKLWVLCSGNGTQFPVLYRIDPASNSVEQSFVFPSLSSSPGKLRLNPGADSLYYLDDGVYKLAVNASALPGQPLIPGGNYLFYGVDVDPGTGDIYVSDAVDYLQQGYVFRFKANGVKVDSFQVGIIPGAFGFN
jgi:hypothetical protein